ncbi:tyrosine--tRNA ligase [Candidatus Pacearchaeota archaeon]|nr:tyrosine--tRNA ligase [Candidatus Pacearchaeota archaeon]
MNVEDRFNLIREVGEEVITEEELKKLLEEKKHPIAYDGFEPSGKIHIAQGALRVININKMIKAGCKFKIFVADWHALANNKLGGDLDKIQTVGKYFIEVWKAAGIDTTNVEFVWGSDLVKDEKYWEKVMKVAVNSTLNRIVRCSQIMGRSESESLQASQIFYPCMQCADIFHLGVDIAQLGMDQRKVNMLAREIGPSLGFWKPVAVHHHMLMGLQEPPEENLPEIEKKIAMKMSKSKPDTAIFMHDPEQEVKRKISKAYCPERKTKDNPIIEYMKYIIFEKYKKIKIERSSKFGGDLELNNCHELESLFSEGKIHPLDLKNTAAKYINEILNPVRQHFEKNKKAKALKEEVESFNITR